MHALNTFAKSNPKLETIDLVMGRVDYTIFGPVTLDLFEDEIDGAHQKLNGGVLLCNIRSGICLYVFRMRSNFRICKGKGYS